MGKLEGFFYGPLFSFFLFLSIYLREREREREQAREGQRERGRERIPSRLHTASAEPDAGFDLLNHEIMT